MTNYRAKRPAAEHVDKQTQNTTVRDTEITIRQQTAHMMNNVNLNHTYWQKEAERHQTLAIERIAIHSICHVPVDVAPTVNSLPHDLEENDTISVKIKHKRSYKHHVLAENIRPNKVLKGLHYLLEHSDMFQKENIKINAAWLRKMTTEYRNEVSHESSDLSQTVDIQKGQDDLDVSEANISSTAMPTDDSTAMLSVETVLMILKKKKKKKKNLHAMHHLLVQC